MKSQKQEHSRKPDELYRIIEECSPGPYLILFARGARPGWDVWGNQAEEYVPSWPTYAHNSHPNKLKKPVKQLASKRILQLPTAFPAC